LKTSIPSIAFAALASIAVLAVAEEPSKFASPFRERGSILGVDLKAIQAAMPEFEKRGLKIDRYKIIVFEDGEVVFVIFDDPQRPPGQKGSTERMSTFEVRLKRTDLSVVGSNFVR
jgi:hypothetical protein